MRRVILGLCFVAMGASAASAQEGKHVAVGVGLTGHSYSDGSFSEKNPSISFIYRLRLHTHPKDGWAWEPTGGLGWFTANLADKSGNTQYNLNLPLPPNTSTRIGRETSRPFMGGIARSYHQGPFTLSFSVIGGPSFNHFSPDGYAKTAYQNLNNGTPLTAKSNTSLAVKPEASMYYDLGSRFALHGSLSYTYDKPTVDTNLSGVQTSTKWNTCHTNVQIGLVVGLF